MCSASILQLLYACVTVLNTEIVSRILFFQIIELAFSNLLYYSRCAVIFMDSFMISKNYLKLVVNARKPTTCFWEILLIVAFIALKLSYYYWH